MMKKVSSRYFLVLFVFSTLPVGCTLISLVYITITWNNLSFSPLFDNDEMSIDEDPNTALKWTCFVSVVPFLFLIICVVEHYQWRNNALVSCLDKRKKVLRFIFFLLTFCVVYVPVAGSHIQTFYLMKSYEVSRNDLLFTLQNFKDAPFSSKMQVLFNCCGVYNYTDWGPDIPFSCCIDLRKPNCTVNVSDIFQKGCFKGVNTFVNVQVRGQTFNVQVYCIAVDVVLLLVGVTSLHFARKVYYRNFQCENS